jgi:hypothetical protein
MTSRTLKTLAAGFIKYNYGVMMGTAEPTKLKNWASQHSNAGVGSLADAAKFADLVVLSVKGTAAAEALRAAGTRSRPTPGAARACRTPLELGAFRGVVLPVRLGCPLGGIQADALGADHVTVTCVGHGDLQRGIDCVPAGVLVLEQVGIDVGDFQGLRGVVVDVQHRFLAKRPRLFLSIRRRLRRIREGLCDQDREHSEGEKLSHLILRHKKGSTCRTLLIAPPGGDGVRQINREPAQGKVHCGASISPTAKVPRRGNVQQFSAAILWALGSKHAKVLKDQV